MKIIDKKLYCEIVKDFENKIESADTVLLDNDISEDERVAKLKEIIEMLKMIDNGIYMLEGRDEPIDLSLPAESNEPYGLETMKDYLKMYYINNLNDKKIRDIYFQYWLLVNDDEYLKPIIEFTTMKIGFLFNCLYRDEKSENIIIDGTEYERRYFFLGPTDSSIIERLRFLVTTFCAIYNKFSVTIRKYMKDPKYIKEYKKFDKIKLLMAPAFLGDDDTLNEEFIMGNLRELLDHFYYIRAILLKKEIIYDRDKEYADLLEDVRSLLEACNYKYKNLVNNFYKTSEYLIDEIDASELLRTTLSKLYNMIDTITELRKKENFTKADLIHILELKRDALYIPMDDKKEENYHLRRIEKLLDRFMQEVIMLISEKIQTEFEEISGRIRSELGEKYKYVEGSAFKSLATAEYLYELLVDVEDPDPEMDYSCISILYYKSLEDTLNKVIYKPYYDGYMSQNPEILRWDGRSNIVLEYLPFNGKKCNTERDAINDIKNNYFKTFDNRNKGRDDRGKGDKGNVAYTPLETLTLGSFSFLLNTNNAPEKLKVFLDSIIKDRENSCNNLSWEIYHIRSNRNNAAHGGNIINLYKVKEDKAHVYTLEEAANYKKLLLKFLNVLK